MTNETYYRNEVLIGNWCEDRVLIQAQKYFVSHQKDETIKDVDSSETLEAQDKTLVPIRLKHLSTKSFLIPGHSIEHRLPGDITCVSAKFKDDPQENEMFFIKLDRSKNPISYGQEILIGYFWNEKLFCLTADYTHIAAMSTFSVSKLALPTFTSVSMNDLQNPKVSLRWKFIPGENLRDTDGSASSHVDFSKPVKVLSCATGRLLATSEQSKKTKFSATQDCFEVYCDIGKDLGKRSLVSREQHGEDVAAPSSFGGDTTLWLLEKDTMKS